MRRPDQLDVRILKEFGSPNSPQWNVRESYERVTDRIGVDEETVRKRVLRMKRARAKELGSLPPWLMKPNPYLLERQGALLDLEVEPELRKAETISKLKQLPGIVTMFDFMGKGVTVILYYENDSTLDRSVNQIGAICGCTPVVVQQVFPQPSVDMKKEDWKIISIMADDARMDLHGVTKLTGITVRTIQRRLAKLIEGKAIYLSGSPFYEKMTGLSCNFLLFSPEIDKKQAMDQKVLSEVPRMERSDTASKEYSLFVINCENPKEADETHAWLKSLDGVEWVRMGITKQAIHVQDWLKAEMEKRASA